MKPVSRITRLASLIAVAIGTALAIGTAPAQAPQEGVHAPSGGARVMLQSIDVPAWQNAPFTATVSTTWVRNLEGGGTYTIQNRRTIARDSSGRIFQERRWLYPAGNPNENLLQRTEIADPHAGTVYFCEPREHKCEIHAYYARKSPAPVIPAGPVDGGKAFLTRELLGNDSVSGVEATGTRETTTYNPGAFGNDQAVSAVKEFWYAPQLGINVVEKRNLPSDGMQTFVVSDISLTEPDPRSFEVPANFEIVDKRDPNDRSAVAGNN